MEVGMKWEWESLRGFPEVPCLIDVSIHAFRTNKAKQHPHLVVLTAPAPGGVLLPSPFMSLAF